MAEDRARFAEATGSDIVVFDIPLLFETGGDAAMDAVAVVTVPEEEQRRRVLARGTMTEADLDRILVRQMPSAEKTARADYVIVTDTPEHARAQVRAVIADIRKRSRADA
ncbi:MAG: Dephospho-CoA kinase [Rhodobacteraceae bacterium HLUCCA24]|nr:MAG: Dephospho-CoA kinase [Rhodobacteraceae bacterium HLUCCA24]